MTELLATFTPNDVLRALSPFGPALGAAALITGLLILRRSYTLALTVSLLVLAASVAAFALRPATVTLSASGTTLAIDGPIRAATTQVVRSLLEANPVERIELRSGWGISSTGEAHRIAGMVRERSVTTTLAGSCSSACALIYLAGREREAPSDPAARWRLVLGPGVDWTAELRRIGAPEPFVADAPGRFAQQRGFASLELVEANVVTRVRPGGASLFCIGLADGTPLSVATALPGTEHWLPRPVGRQRSACGHGVRMQGEAGRFDLRIVSGAGREHVCRGVLLRGLGDFLALSDGGEAPTLRIERRGFWLGRSGEPRTQTLQCA